MNRVREILNSCTCTHFIFGNEKAGASFWTLFRRRFWLSLVILWVGASRGHWLGALFDRRRPFLAYSGVPGRRGIRLLHLDWTSVVNITSSKTFQLARSCQALWNLWSARGCLFTGVGLHLLGLRLGLFGGCGNCSSAGRRCKIADIHLGKVRGRILIKWTERLRTYIK